MNKRLLYKLAIETPVFTLVIILVMSISLYLLCMHNKTDIYLETKGKLEYCEDGFMVRLKIDIAYYEEVIQRNKALWYKSLESAMYTATIESVLIGIEDAEVLLYILQKDLEREFDLQNCIGEEINIKICFNEDLIAKRIFKLRRY